ncbi:hypothetical protein [uncultured Nocardioides sp.]|uniref:hypothetical protein n=1 Tax=uncultured Nocardioides sp. TaxID=198441 RepID=UPI00261FAC20|nr:hypothetical protein [uncultured Nocardioides sp.]
MITTTATSLIPEAEPNLMLHSNVDDRARWCVALDAELPWEDAAELDALQGPVPPDLVAVDPETPLLRWADHRIAAVALVGAVVDPPRHRAKACDRCATTLRGLRVERLWLPCEQSAVELQVCGLCARILNDLYRQSDDHGCAAGRALVWR